VQRLAELYQVSPTPVREALVELASLGLVDLLPNRGAVVRPFGPQEVREISQVRCVLEVEATRCACGRIDLVADRCGNTRLTADVKRYHTLFRALRDVSHQRDARYHYTRSDDVPEHLAIVHALLADDADGAAQAMDRHVRSAAKTLEAVVFAAD
jgi:DNA-binding GntR family transcriptional regulator